MPHRPWSRPGLAGQLSEDGAPDLSTRECSSVRSHGEVNVAARSQFPLPFAFPAPFALAELGIAGVALPAPGSAASAILWVTCPALPLALALALREFGLFVNALAVTVARPSSRTFGKRLVAVIGLMLASALALAELRCESPARCTQPQRAGNARLRGTGSPSAFQAQSSKAAFIPGPYAGVLEFPVFPIAGIALAPPDGFQRAIFRRPSPAPRADPGWPGTVGSWGHGLAPALPTLGVTVGGHGAASLRSLPCRESHRRRRLAEGRQAVLADMGGWRVDECSLRLGSREVGAARTPRDQSSGLAFGSCVGTPSPSPRCCSERHSPDVQVPSSPGDLPEALPPAWPTRPFLIAGLWVRVAGDGFPAPQLVQRSSLLLQPGWRRNPRR